MIKTHIIFYIHVYKMLNNDQVICDKIKQILRPYNKPLHGDIQISKKYTVPKDEYVHFSNMALQMLANTIDGRDDDLKKIIKSRMIYLEDIFTMYRINRTACTGRVDLLTNIDLTSQHTTQTQIRIKSNTEDTGEFIRIQDFVDEFYNRLESSTCKYGKLVFNSLAIENFATIKYSDTEFRKSGHANMLVVLKNTETKVIKLLLYEPHGYSEEDDNTYMKYLRDYHVYFIKTIRRYLQKKYKHFKITFLKPVQVNCPRGVQHYIGDKFGYCKLISTMWLFVLLGLFVSDLSSEVKIYLSDNLQLIESCLLNFQNLYNIVINFSTDIINKYLKHFTSQETISVFNSLFQISYNLYYNPEGGDKREINLLMKRFKKPVDRHIDKILNSYVKKFTGRDNCTECTSQSQCKSGNCVNNICSPGHFYSKHKSKADISLLSGQNYNKDGNLPKKLGDLCTNHAECCSENCISKINQNTGIRNKKRCS